MAIYGISDLHLAIGIDKPMDIFGARWANYMDRLSIEWKDTVAADDTVIIPGDISWATYLEQAYEDFRFIDELPGRKIISKGNHDYWWTTMNKLEQFLLEKEITTISFMHNNSFKVGDYAICGTRGWKMPGDDDFSAEDRKIYMRELNRLELSLNSVEVMPCEKIILAMHYPIFNSKGVNNDFLGIMLKYNVKICIFGHLHGDACLKYYFRWNICRSIVKLF
jgi:predicted phosphohydrolase